MANRASVLLGRGELSLTIAALDGEIVDLKEKKDDLYLLSSPEVKRLVDLATLQGRLLEAEAYIASDN